MTTIGPDAILIAFILFCRIGACFMILPGVASSRIPVRIRLFISLAATLALSPLLGPDVGEKLPQAAPFQTLQIIVVESVIGALIGLLSRIFFGALDTMANAIAMAIGLSSPLTPPADDHEPAPSVVSLISLGAVTLFFVANLHLEVLRGLVASYVAWPVSGHFDARLGLVEISNVLARAFILVLRIGSPFLAYALTVNLAVGLAARFVPQIPIYFVTTPAVTAGGLALLYFTCRPLLESFNAGFLLWLRSG